MAVLYLTEQGAIVRKTGDRLIVEKEHETLAEIPCAKLESILIFGNIQVTTPALAELLDQGIELTFLTVSGRLRGQLTPPKAKNLPLRMRQYDAARDEVFRLDIARIAPRRWRSTCSKSSARRSSTALPQLFSPSAGSRAPISSPPRKEASS